MVKHVKIKHRKSLKDRALGTWRQYMEVKHGTIGVIIVSICVIMAFIAPIMYPDYPGQLARVAPDYSAPEWLRFTDPLAPPYKNYVLDSYFENDLSWILVNGTDPLTGMPDEHGYIEYDSTEGNFTHGSRSIKMTLWDDSETLAYRTNVKATSSFRYNYTTPTWVNIAFRYKTDFSENNTYSVSKLVPYVRLIMPPESSSSYPAYLARVDAKPVSNKYPEVWTKIIRNMTFLGFYTVFTPNSTVDIEIGFEFTSPFSTGMNKVAPKRNETGVATVWFDEIQVFCYSQYYGLMGTTNQGQDVMAQLLWGTQVSLYVGLVATLVGVVVGLIVGLTSGYFGGIIDEILMRIVDLFLIMPSLPIMMILAALFNPSLEITIFVIAVFAWPGTSRLIRSQVLVEKEKAYVEAAKAAGAGDVYLIYKHVFPNVLTLVFVQLATGVSGAILSEAALSFLALTPQNLVSWGRMLQEGYNAGALINNAWWFIIPPGLMICFISMGFVFIGYAVDNAMNPKQRKL